MKSSKLSELFCLHVIPDQVGNPVVYGTHQQKLVANITEFPVTLGMADVYISARTNGRTHLQCPTIHHLNERYNVRVFTNCEMLSML